MSSLTEPDPNLHEADGTDANALAAGTPPAYQRASDTPPTAMISPTDSGGNAVAPASDAMDDPAETGEEAFIKEESPSGPARSHRPSARWLLLAAGSALLLILLTIAGVYVITKSPSTVDNLVILTVPSGAEINLGGKNYGQSPVKIEQLKKGLYTVVITREGYEPIVEEITVSKSEPLEFKLRMLPPADYRGLSPEELVKSSQQRADDAFARGHYGIPFEYSALYYAELILGFEPSNQFAIDMRERVRKALHQSAKAADAKNHLGQAQEIYALLVEYYPDDIEARAAAARVEARLSSRRGEVRDLVRKAEEALRANRLIEPDGESAYYYSKEVLAIDSQNSQARTIRNRVKERLARTSDEAIARGDIEGAIRQLEKITQYFPEDKQLLARLRDLSNQHAAEAAKTNNPDTRRVAGLDSYRQGYYAEAISDLEFAITNNRGTAEVIFALADSHWKLGHLETAASYFRQVPSVATETYRSSIAALGDIASEQGDKSTALDQYKKARRLGGSTRYSIAMLDDKIEAIENQQRQRAAEPIPVMIQAKHNHGGIFGGSCEGRLSVSSNGVRYDGSEHSFSASLVGVGITINEKAEMIVKHQNKSDKFKVLRADADRFQDTLVKYQRYFSTGN